MALDFKNIPVKMTEGIDTKSDPKSLMTKLLALQNASFQSPGQLIKRDGFSALPQAIQGGGSMSSGAGIASFKNELMSMDGQSIYSYSPDLSKQVNKGLFVPTSISVLPIVRNAYLQTTPDSAYDPVTKLQCFIWTDSSTGGINYSIFDTTTNTQIVSNKILDSGFGESAKVLLIGTKFVIIIYQTTAPSGSIFYTSIDTSTPSTIGSSVFLPVSGFITIPHFDATVINGSIYFAYQYSPTQIRMYSLSSSLVLSSPHDVTTGQTLTSGQNLSLSIVGDSSFNVWVTIGLATISGSPFLETFVVNAALNTNILSPTAIESSYAYPNIIQVISGTTATIYYETLATSLVSNNIRTNTITIGGTVGTPSSFTLGVGLASKPFIRNGVTYFLTVYSGVNNYNSLSQLNPTTIEPTYFLYNGSAQLIAKIAPSLAGLYYVTGLLPEISSLASGQWSIPYLLQESTNSLAQQVINGAVFAPTGVQNVTFNFNVPYAIQKISAANNLNLAGGQLWSYDGQNIVEQGFHLYPENLVLSGQTYFGGGIGVSLNTSTVNQFQYKAVYEWTDNQGQVHRSAPSTPLTVQLLASSFNTLTFTGTSTAGSNVITGINSFAGLMVGQVITDAINPTSIAPGTAISQINTATNTMTLNTPVLANGTTFNTKDRGLIQVAIPTLKQTLKQNISIVLYRTQNNQTIFYRVTSPTLVQAKNGLTINDPTASTAFINDVLPDSAIIGNEELYTTGGEVPNINAPAISAICSYKNRAIALTPENPFQWIYTKQVIDGVPLEFSSELFVENIDQRIGQATAVGPLDDKLIIFGPRSKYYVVGAGPSPAGTNNDFSDATLIAGTTGTTNPASVIEIPIGLIYQDPIKGIMLLNRSLEEMYIGADVEAYNSYTITSAALIPNSRKVMFTLNTGVNLVYDYFVSQWEVDPFPSAVVDSTTFENDLCYIQANGLILQQTPNVFSDNGSVIPMSLKSGWISFAGLEGFQRVTEMQIMGTYFSPHTLTINFYTDFGTTPVQTRTIVVGSDPKPYQFRIHLEEQKCETMQFEIIESQSGSPGQGFSLSSIAFRVGAKKGLNKLPAGVSY